MFILIPGAGGSEWYWSRVVARLQEAGHQAQAVDLPGEDPAAGLDVYAKLVVDAIGDRGDVTLVAQSLGGFTAAMVAAQAPLAELVLVNAMIPVPGETAGEWWANTGAVQARDAGGWGEFDVETYFLHDVAPEVAAEGASHARDEASAVFASTCSFDAWPSCPIRVLSGADDRFFPVSFQQRVARERLRVEPDVIAGGHLVALSEPKTVTQYLMSNAMNK